MVAVAILSPSKKSSASSHQRTLVPQFIRRNKIYNQTKDHALSAAEAAGVAVVLLVIFGIGVGLVLYRQKQDATRQPTVEASRKRAEKQPAARKDAKPSSRRPQVLPSIHQPRDSDAQPSYLRFWTEPPPRVGAMFSRDGITMGSICGCDECLTIMDGLP